TACWTWWKRSSSRSRCKPSAAWPSTAPAARRRPRSWGCPWRPSTWPSRASWPASARRQKGSLTDGCLLPSPPCTRGARGEKSDSCKVVRPVPFLYGEGAVSFGHRTNPDRLVMNEVPLNHPGDEALRALSLGQLAEAELATVYGHLSECPACCHRIDQLAT